MHHTTDQPPLTPESAFDALYVSTVPGLTQQAYVLTGCRRLAFESAEQAFHRAWEHWPEVARDPDPVAWVRARSHEYALSPWHRLRPGLYRPASLPADPVVRALQELPPWQRRVALLCDGLDLSIEEAAAETQATTAATAGRLRHARATISRQMPGTDPDTRTRAETDTHTNAACHALRARVKDASAATLAQPWSVRAASERRARALTRAVLAATAVLIALIAVTVAMTPDP
ncbi:sigma factor-like helix-turn-helix DNA-binding protein [Streptomyces sp. HUAS MG47]|uniref:sigma factor-like helix-turn-helix DNA-binding protein n=1 Tax=Streptomyces solicamelliae TaxID=3231716 RepID=UPI0038779601